MALSNSTWAFTPIVEAFPQTVLPNVAYWNVTNGSDLEYQVSLSWPLDWPASREVENKTALTMYVGLGILSADTPPTIYLLTCSPRK